MEVYHTAPRDSGPEKAFPRRPDRAADVRGRRAAETGARKALWNLMGGMIGLRNTP